MIRDLVITVADCVTALVATRKSHDEVAAGDLTRALTATWGDPVRFLRRGAPGGGSGRSPELGTARDNARHAGGAWGRGVPAGAPRGFGA